MSRRIKDFISKKPGKLAVLVSLCGLAALGLLSYGGKHNMVIDDAGSGKFIHYESFPSDLVEPRPVDVWLPKNYGQSDDRYPVIYMHDGQFTFDRPTSPYTSIWERIKGSIYGGLFWDVDKTMVRLIAKKQIRPAIVVSIWNLPKGRRRTEYMPQKPVTEEVDKLIQTQSDISLTKITSDNYLKFLVSELKPFIDSTYLTKPDADNTLIFGSSMGGMISAYAISEYPEVFGAAACLSTHWSTGGDAIIDWYEDHWPTAGKHRLYFDYGTKSLDADYEPFQKKMDALMLKKGYRDNKDWVTRRFEDASHTPKAWRERLHVPLIFLLGS